MKIDRVLTIEECLDEWGAVPVRVDPPASGARHVPIAEEKDVDVRRNERKCNCNCDRWGHPCPDCLDCKMQTRTASQLFSSAEQVRRTKWNT